MWDRGGNSLFSSAFHKTQTIDYGILIGGERQLILDDCTLTMKPGDIVVQVGAWHQWSNAKEGALMVFDMFAARFVDGSAGLAQGNDQPLKPKAKLPDGMKATRRIVTIDRENGKGSLVSDGPAPDIRFDPARPGFALERLWVTDEHPAKIVYESLQVPDVLVPRAGGTVCNVMTVPPDESWKGKVGAGEVKAFFAAVGAPNAQAYSPLAPHPYMQKTKTLDFCIVLDGEAVLSSTRRKCPSRRAISSFSVAPATRGAIDRANQRELRSARTMRKLDVRLRGCITSLLAFNGSA